MFNKKAVVNPIEMVIMIVVFAGVLLSFAYILTTLSNLNIDDREIRSQIISKKLVQNCFSDEYAKIEEVKFTKENLDNCFDSIDETNIFRVGIENGKRLYIGNSEQIFLQRGNLCSINQKGSQFCNQYVFPIIYEEENGAQSVKFLVADIIIV